MDTIQYVMGRLWALLVGGEVPGAADKVLGTENIGKSRLDRQLLLQNCLSRSLLPSTPTVATPHTE